jgi:hypothetical protein
LPFEPVDKVRLQILKAARLQARNGTASGVSVLEARRRRAQMAARHALRVTAGTNRFGTLPDSGRAIAAAIHAAELQLPESWLPFVVAQ